jgi:hypothetical protein
MGLLAATLLIPNHTITDARLNIEHDRSAPHQQ